MELKINKNYFVMFLFFKIINLNYGISFKIKNICLMVLNICKHILMVLNI